MQTDSTTYDCAIIGGGLAGLVLSVRLAEQGCSVVLFERNSYPFHKVCGEYISMESWGFMERLGLPLADMNLPIIDTVNITNVDGLKISSPLKMGGFGISRYTLDNALVTLARKNGVHVIEAAKVNNVQTVDDVCLIITSKGTFRSTVACGSYGKSYPHFMPKTTSQKNSYIAVKYHIKTKLAENLIELHNFKDGYCGISKVDNDTYCLCYLTTSKNLLNNNNDIKQLEENVLMINPYLRKLFTESQFLFEKPLVISQVSFKKKSTNNNGLLLVGDAAGAIAPLCGNGMSIAIRSANFLSDYIVQFLRQEITREELLAAYKKEWAVNFNKRILSGYYLQQVFGKKTITSICMRVLALSPGLFHYVIRLTHGDRY